MKAKSNHIRTAPQLRRTLSLLIGTALETGAPVTIPFEALLSHFYVCGGTRVGKSKAVEHFIRESIRMWPYHGRGLLLLDGHDDLCTSLVKWLAWHYPMMDRPVVVIDFSRPDWLPNYHVLRPQQREPSVLVRSIVEAMAHAAGKPDTLDTPRFADSAAIVVGSLLDLKLTLSDAGYFLKYANKAWRHAMLSRLSSQDLREEWSSTLNDLPVQFEEKFGSTARRFRPFRQNKILHGFFGYGDGPSFDFRRAMDEGWIVLVNLSSEGGHISREDASVIGAVLLHDAWSAAEERGKGKGKGRPFHIVCDEFQRFLSPALAEGMDQAAGFGLRLMLSHQYPTQLLNRGPQGKAIYDSVMANARSKMVFSTEQPQDLPVLTDWLYRHEMDPDLVKREFISRKVMDYREEWRPSFTNSITEGVSATDGLTLSEARSQGGSGSLAAHLGKASGMGNGRNESNGNMAAWGASAGSSGGVVWPGSGGDCTTIDSMSNNWSDVQSFCSSEGISSSEFLSWALGLGGGISFSSSKSRARAQTLAKAITRSTGRGVTLSSRLEPIMKDKCRTCNGDR